MINNDFNENFNVLRKKKPGITQDLSGDAFFNGKIVNGGMQINLGSAHPATFLIVTDLGDFKIEKCKGLSEEEKIFKRNWRALQHYEWVCKFIYLSIYLFFF